MIEKLRVRNFGPLSDIEILIRDINIFTGTPSSGKSTAAKLITIFKSSLLTFNPNSINFKYSDDEYIKLNKLLNQFNIDFINDNSFIRYEYGSFFYQLEHGVVSSNFNSANVKRVFKPIYIPAERIFFPTFSQSIFNFLNHDFGLPRWLVEFGAQFEKAKTAVNRFKIDFLNVQYEFKNGNDLVELTDGTVLKLCKASSSLQSIIPLMVVVRHNTAVAHKNDCLFFIEEPELNLYPATQKQLIEFIIDRVTYSDDKLIITTHSPYLLTSLVDILQPENEMENNPELNGQTVSSNKSIASSKISSYFFDKGTAISTPNVLSSGLTNL